MNPNKPVYLELLSDTFSEESQLLKINFKLTFHSNENDVNLPEGSPSQSDLLQISFKQQKKIPTEVEEYIINNLGIFDLKDDPKTHNKILSFELKINDIDSEKILQVFDDFFVKRLSEAKLEVNYAKSQSLDEFAIDLKSFYQVPILLQLIEQARVNVEVSHHHQLIEGFVQYLKSQNQLALANFLKSFKTVGSVQGKLGFTSFKKGLEMDFKAMSLDQRDLLKEFFLAFENPLVKFIFENGQEGVLKIKGRILNILNYEVDVEAKNATEFLHKVRNM